MANEEERNNLVEDLLDPEDGPDPEDDLVPEDLLVPEDGPDPEDDLVPEDDLDPEDNPDPEDDDDPEDEDDPQDDPFGFLAEHARVFANLEAATAAHRAVMNDNLASAATKLANMVAERNSAHATITQLRQLNTELTLSSAGGSIDPDLFARSLVISFASLEDEQAQTRRDLEQYKRSAERFEEIGDYWKRKYEALRDGRAEDSDEEDGQA